MARGKEELSAHCPNFGALTQMSTSFSSVVRPGYRFGGDIYYVLCYTPCSKSSNLTKVVTLLLRLRDTHARANKLSSFNVV